MTPVACFSFMWHDWSVCLKVCIPLVLYNAQTCSLEWQAWVQCTFQRDSLLCDQCGDSQQQSGSWSLALQNCVSFDPLLMIILSREDCGLMQQRRWQRDFLMSYSFATVPTWIAALVRWRQKENRTQCSGMRCCPLHQACIIKWKEAPSPQFHLMSFWGSFAVQTTRVDAIRDQVDWHLLLLRAFGLKNFEQVGVLLGTTLMFDGFFFFFPSFFF